MAKIIRADGTEEELHGPRGPGTRLAHEQLRAGVSGGVEVVFPTCTGTLARGECLVVNDEGMVDGLPINERASQLAGQPIAGDVVHAKFGTEVD